MNGEPDDVSSNFLLRTLKYGDVFYLKTNRPLWNKLASISLAMSQVYVSIGYLLLRSGLLLGDPPMSLD